MGWLSQLSRGGAVVVLLEAMIEDQVAASRRGAQDKVRVLVVQPRSDKFQQSWGLTSADCSQMMFMTGFVSACVASVRLRGEHG